MQADTLDPDRVKECAAGSVRHGITSCWVKALLLFSIVLVLAGGSVVLFLMYVGVMGPATYVYSPGQTPRRFLAVAEEVGGLQPGEKVEFFYSEGFIDVREGFTYVSDRKVVIYDPEGEPPLVATEYRDIQGLELDRDESILVDSLITLEVEDSSIVIPVSSEKDRDIEFYEAIRSRVSVAN